MRKRSNVVNELEEFNKNGFIEISRHIKSIKKRIWSIYKIFKSANKSKGVNVKYRTHDLFGEILNYYYDIRRKDEFVSFLEKKFREHNTDYDINTGKRGAVTRLLHIHDL